MGTEGQEARGKEPLLIVKIVRLNVKGRDTKLTKTWADCKKAYVIVLPSGIQETMAHTEVTHWEGTAWGCHRLSMKALVHTVVVTRKNAHIFNTINYLLVVLIDSSLKSGCLFVYEMQKMLEG